MDDEEMLLNMAHRMLEQLDIEAKKLMRVAKNSSRSLVVENPKILGNLRGAKHSSHWARSYFGSRLKILCSENEVFYWHVNPAYTSTTCLSCKVVDKRSRVKLDFKCVACGFESHADLNAARNVARKGSRGIAKAFPIKAA